jgi:hypothetical protein
VTARALDLRWGGVGVVGWVLGVPSIMGRTLLLFEPGGWSLGLGLLL